MPDLEKQLELALRALTNIAETADISTGAAAKFYGALAWAGVSAARAGEIPELPAVGPDEDGEPPVEVAHLIEYVGVRIADGADIGELQAALESVELVPTLISHAGPCDCDACTAVRLLMESVSTRH